MKAPKPEKQKTFKKLKSRKRSIKANSKKRTKRGLNLNWCVGLNYNLTNGVINLTTDNKKEIFYVSGHVGILYDYMNKKQLLFQGHSNEITAIVYNQNKKIIVTADKGESCMMIIWSQKRNIPIRTYFDIDIIGIKSMDISKDGKLILTLSFLRNGFQKICVYDWENFDNNLPINSVEESVSDPLDEYSYIKWNYNEFEEFATTGKRIVKFWKRQKDGTCLGYAPFVVRKDEKKKENQREFTQTVFIPENQGAQAVTGTEDGNLIVWDVILILEELANLNNRREIKSINLLNNSKKKYGDINPSISLIDIFENIIVIGTSVGTVRFYDFRFRIICWFEDLNLGKINSISFSQSTMPNTNIKELQQTADDNQISYNDFVVCDTGAKITLLGTHLFSQIDAAKRKGEEILRSVQTEIKWMTIDSKSQNIALSCKNGQILEWKMFSCEMKVLKNFKTTNQNQKEEIGTCLEYSPDNKYLIVGTNNGNLFVKRKDKKSFNQTPLLISHKKKDIICKKLVFSNCSQFLAISDSFKCVSVFTLDHKYGDINSPIEWVFKGKMRAHTLQITDICWSQSLTKPYDVPTLFSISEDMYLVEYDCGKKGSSSSEEKQNKKSIFVKNFEKIESNDYPVACISYPRKFLGKNAILISNNGYKLKVWVDKDGTKVCKQTNLGPSFGGAITNMKYLNQKSSKSENKNEYIAFQTNFKVLGIIKLPLDGSPHNSIGVLSNPGKINHICTSRKGEYILTAGGSDLSLNIWEVNYENLKTNPLINLEVNNPLDIYPELLEGGENGPLYRDLKDFFYYSQIRKKEKNTTKAHKLDGKIPLQEIPNLMIALGYYPSLKEIQNMMNEVESSGKDGEKVKNLSLKNFVKLFINHRSPYGLTQEYLQSKLKPIFKGKSKISRTEFLDLLMNFGEQFPKQDIKKYVNILLGEGEIEDLIPEKVGLDFVVQNLLGFETQNENINQNEQEE